MTLLILSLSFSPALLGVVDAFIKREYESAMEVVPHLVRRETKIIDFLRTENFNPLNAANRFALYWKVSRINCFMFLHMSRHKMLLYIIITFLTVERG